MYVDIGVHVYLETELYPDTEFNEYLVAWIEADREYPIMKTFKNYDTADRYVHDLVLANSDGVFCHYSTPLATVAAADH